MSSSPPRKDAADVTWTNASFTTSHGVIYVDPPIRRIRRLLIWLRLARQPQAKIVATFDPTGTWPLLDSDMTVVLTNTEIIE